jgi:transposase InsO family protein
VKLAATYPLRLVCRLLGVPRSSVYYTPRPPLDDAMLKTALLDLAAEWPRFGYRRLTALMQRFGWPVNGKRVRRWMEELNLCGAPPERKCRTTDSRHGFPRYENLVKSLEITRPDHVWVADITYIRLHHEFIYLAVLMDVFTRTIRGWQLSRSIDQGLTLAALERALVTATPTIHHSDQGVQYAATAYVERLQSLGVTLSMAAVGEPRENGYAERLMRTIKEEEVDLSEYSDFADARRQIGRFLDDVYNVKRIHSSLGYLTPREFEQQWHTPTPAPTTTSTWAEDRAPVGTDPSADPGAEADRDGRTPSFCPPVLASCEKSTPAQTTNKNRRPMVQF